MSTSWRAYCPVCKKGFVSTTGRDPVTLEDNHPFIWEHAAGTCKADVQLLREYNGRYWTFCEMGYEHKKENKMGFHPKKDYEVFYEVTDQNGETLWGGGGEHDAVDWFYRSPVGSRLYVSAWESDDVDAQPIGRTIDITPLIGAVRGGGRE